MILKGFLKVQINERQELHERWMVKFSRLPGDKLHAAAIEIPHPMLASTHGYGKSIEEARIDVLVNAASSYIDVGEDEDWAVSDDTLTRIAKAVRREQDRRKRIERLKGK